MAKVAWIGLGVMGFPMAGHIRTKGGHELTVFNRNRVKAEAWTQKFGGRVASTPAEAAAGADFVFACVGNDDDLRIVTTGTDGAFGTLGAGAIFIDNTTASAAVARELDAAARARGAHFLDAPVSGGQAGAENGVLTVMIGGEAAVFERAKPVIDCYARMSRLIGPTGAGQLTKMVNQICIAGVVQGLAEAIHFAQSAGLDTDAVVETISKGAAQSWQMENRWKTIARDEFEFGFAVDWMRKDLAICLEEAKANGVSLPMTALVDQYYGDVQAMGGRRWDTSSLIRRLRQLGKAY
ncbi:MAG: NAD-binding protein [Rhizobiales bacterium]|nr:NAD-binding protein [Hyphomicrobiales bacterium]